MTVLLPAQHKAQTLFLVEEILKTVAYVHMANADIAAVKGHLAAMMQDKRDMTVQCEVATFEDGKTSLNLVFDFKPLPPLKEGLDS